MPHNSKSLLYVAVSLYLLFKDEMVDMYRGTNRHSKAQPDERSLRDTFASKGPETNQQQPGQEKGEPVTFMDQQKW